jgi:hypothetical protein
VYAAQHVHSMQASQPAERLPEQVLLAEGQVGVDLVQLDFDVQEQVAHVFVPLARHDLRHGVEVIFRHLRRCSTMSQPC